MFKFGGKKQRNEVKENLEAFSMAVFGNVDTHIDGKQLNAIENQEYADVGEGLSIKAVRRNNGATLCFMTKDIEIELDLISREIYYLLCCVVAVKDGYGRGYHLSDPSSNLTISIHRLVNGYFKFEVGSNIQKDISIISDNDRIMKTIEFILLHTIMSSNLSSDIPKEVADKEKKEKKPTNKHSIFDLNKSTNLFGDFVDDYDDY